MAFFRSNRTYLIWNLLWHVKYHKETRWVFLCNKIILNISKFSSFLDFKKNHKKLIQISQVFEMIFIRKKTLGVAEFAKSFKKVNENFFSNLLKSTEDNLSHVLTKSMIHLLQSISFIKWSQRWWVCALFCHHF